MMRLTRRQFTATATASVAALPFAPGLGQSRSALADNEESMTLRAGPFLVGPGQTYTQRFPNPDDYPIACTVDPAEFVVVTVEA